LREESDSREKALIISECEDLLSIQMPFRSISVNSKVVFQSAGLGSILVMSQERLRTEKLVRESFVYEHIIIKGEKVPEVIERFPIGFANVFHKDVAADPTYI